MQMSSQKIAVIGAGMTGIACARILDDAGLAVTVFDKGRGLGGRLATRRTPEGLSFDHGAQFVTARSDAFRAWTAPLIDGGHVADWHPEGTERAGHDSDPWLVGVPGMNAFVKAGAQGLDVRLSTLVTAIERDHGAIRMRTEENPEGDTFDHVAMTVPAPQAVALLSSEPDMAAALDRVAMAPCWALLIAFAEPLGTGFEARRFETGDLGWLCRNTSKPGRDGARADCWMAHAGPAWSAANLERRAEDVLPDLIDMVAAHADGPLPPIVYSAAHRWRYALTTTPLGAPFLASVDGRLLTGGDWALGARVEYAFQSGQAMADAILRSAGGQA